MNYSLILNVYVPLVSAVWISMARVTYVIFYPNKDIFECGNINWDCHSKLGHMITLIKGFLL